MSQHRQLETCVESFYCCFATDSQQLSQLSPDDQQQLSQLGQQEDTDDDGGDDSGLVQLMSRGRRVNDDVSQCIQSYCSGKMFPERLRCIVKNCHRTGASV